MSFYPQPGDYQCGPFALKYAFIMLGLFLDENKIGIAAGSTWWAGTDEIGLSKAARKYNCRLKYFCEYSPAPALKLLNNHLKKGYPCILSVNNWEHWATVVNFSNGKYVVIDSEHDKVIRVLSPKQLARIWKYYEEDEDYYSYDAYALIPKFKVKSRAKFRLEAAKSIMFKKNEQLALKWDQYFNDMISVCSPRTSNSQFYTFKQFCRRNGNLIVKKVADWHGVPSYHELETILNNLMIIASVYDLVIPVSKEKKALVDVTSILMLYACGKYGMDPIY